jgi:hypothetical protein
MTDSKDSKTAEAMLTGSEEAKRKMALLLEALAGLRTIQSACTELGIAAPQYYALETRMLQAMVDAMEPRKRGRPVDLHQELERQRQAYVDLERELERVRALHRATQRAVGIREERGGSASGSKKSAAAKKKAPTTLRRKAPKKTRAQKLSERIDGSARIGASDPKPRPKMPADESGAPEQRS